MEAAIVTARIGSIVSCEVEWGATKNNYTNFDLAYVSFIYGAPHIGYNYPGGEGDELATHGPLTLVA